MEKNKRKIVAHKDLRGSVYETYVHGQGDRDFLFFSFEGKTNIEDIKKTLYIF